ncbi:hypothetical protein ACLOJK_014776 [Asimina triloba]
MCAQFDAPPEHRNSVLHLPPRGCNGRSIFFGSRNQHLPTSTGQQGDASSTWIGRQAARISHRDDRPNNRRQRWHFPDPGDGRSTFFNSSDEQRPRLQPPFNQNLAKANPWPIICNLLADSKSWASGSIQWPTDHGSWPTFIIMAQW